MPRITYKKQNYSSQLVFTCSKFSRSTSKGCEICSKLTTMSQGTRIKTVQIQKHEQCHKHLSYKEHILTGAMNGWGMQARASSITPDLPRNSPLVGLKGSAKRTEEFNAYFKSITENELLFKIRKLIGIYQLELLGLQQLEVT